jgi:hypothetical protein
VFTQPVGTPSAWREVASVANMTPDHVVVPLEGVGRIGLVATVGKPVGKAQQELRLAEVSVGTGAVMYDGKLTVGSPIGINDYRLIAVLLGYAVGMVVIFVVKPPARDSVHLPPGVSIAENGRRMIATVIDLLIALLVACKILGVPISEFASSGLLTPGPGQNAALLALGMLILANGVLESLFGRSLGKMIAGCGVVLMQSGAAPASGETPEPQAPPLWRSLVRNFVKWGLPPVALLGMLDPGGRHRADLLAGTAVVIEAEEEDGEEPEG